MKQNFKLTKDQQTLVEKNLSIVHWVIVNNIHVNPGICGLEYIVHLKQGGYGIREIARTQKVPMRRIKELLAEVHDVLLDICYG